MGDNEYMKRSTPPLFCLLLLLTLFITLTPFFKVGFTNGDDVEYYMRYVQDKHAFNDPFAQEKPPLVTAQSWQKYRDDARLYARSGRFYFLITKPLYSLPYLFDNFYFTKCFQYFFLLLSFAVSARLVGKIFHSKGLAWLFFIGLIIPLSVMPHNAYVATTNYPFFFTFSFTLVLLSVLLVLRYYETGKYRLLLFAVALYAVTLLFYETYLVFLGFLLLFLLLRALKKEGWKALKDKKSYREILPFFLLGVAYVAVYFSYRAVVQSDEGFYEGSRWASNFDWGHFFQILFGYNRYVIPTQIYHFSQEVIAENSLLPQGHQDRFFYILFHSQPLSIVNAVIQTALFLFILRRTGNNPHWKAWTVALVAAFLFTLSAHLLIAVSDKYNSTYFNFRGYVTSYYALFGITLIAILLMYGIYKACRSYRYLRYAALALLAAGGFYTSIITSYTNDHLSRDWSRSQFRFEMLRKLSRQGSFHGIPDSAVVYSGDLYQSSSHYGQAIFWPGFHWEHFIHAQGGPKLTMYKTFSELKEVLPERPSHPLFVIQKKESGKDNDMGILIAEIDRRSLDWDSEDPLESARCIGKSYLHYASPARSFRVSYAGAGDSIGGVCDPVWHAFSLGTAGAAQSIHPCVLPAEGILLRSVEIVPETK